MSIVTSLTGKAPVLPDWTVAPWKRKLEGLEEIEDAPADDDIIVEAYKSANLGESQRKLITHV